MNITPVTFSQKWDIMISPKNQMDHCETALYNHVITVATAVSFVALAVFSSIVFPEIASFLIIATAFLLTPGIELARIFLNKAQEERKLEEQSIKVRAIYNKFLIIKADNPEIKALHEHWHNKAEKAQKSYELVYQKALDKGSNPQTYSGVITKYRSEALAAEQEAKTIKVYALFLESLIKKPKEFQQVFLKYGENFSKALSDVAEWDTRDTLVRATDPRFTNKDTLLFFSNKKIRPISYSEVYQDELKFNLKNRLCTSLLTEVAS
jgi:hypothetical protein